MTKQEGVWLLSHVLHNVLFKNVLDKRTAFPLSASFSFHRALQWSRRRSGSGGQGTRGPQQLYLPPQGLFNESCVSHHSCRTFQRLSFEQKHVWREHEEAFLLKPEGDWNRDKTEAAEISRQSAAPTGAAALQGQRRLQPTPKGFMGRFSSGS